MPAPSRRPGLPTMLFLSELANIGFENIPPVTLGLIAAQFLIYFGLLDDFHSFEARDVCIGYDTVWKRFDFLRLFTGALVHLDEWHLYFNMASLLWKGTRLEGRRFSSPYYFLIVLTFIPLCGLGTIMLDYLLADLMDDYGRLHTCAAGFSGVIFALKVLASHYDDAHTVMIMGAFPVNSRYACWAELVAIQMVTPNASFTGHLAGIIVGLLFIYKPLKSLIDFMYYTIVAPILGLGSTRPPNRNQTAGGWNFWFTPFSGQGQQLGGASRAAYASPAANNNTSNGAPPFSGYTAGLSEEDQLAWALNESIHQTPTRRQWSGSAGNRQASPPPRYGWNVGSS